MAQFGATLDSCEVLGVDAGASLREIRDAYHEKAKRYHPDLQGDPWAFRIVNRAYEILSTARVAMRAEEEFARPPRESRAAQTRTARPESAPREFERIRAVVRDEVSDHARLVDVELLILRFAMEDPLDYLLKGSEERNLSCSLNVSWPSRRNGEPTIGSDAAKSIVRALAGAFDPIPKKSRASASWSRADDDRFEGWLSYPSAVQAREAFDALHRAFQKRGLGVEHWSRELILERRGS
jgi:curved DNA-binding protein CbpA